MFFIFLFPLPEGQVVHLIKVHIFTKPLGSFSSLFIDIIVGSLQLKDDFFLYAGMI